MFITEEIIIYILFAVSILLILWVLRLEIKIGGLGVAKDTKGLKNKFNVIESELGDLRQSEKNTKNNFLSIENRLQNNIQNIEIVRFNPFKNDGIGGDQSFAISFLNKKGNGVIMSSLYTRDKVSVFAKPIENWQSKYELSEEEKNVLERAKNKN